MLYLPNVDCKTVWDPKRKKTGSGLEVSGLEVSCQASGYSTGSCPNGSSTDPDNCCECSLNPGSGPHSRDVPHSRDLGRDKEHYQWYNHGYESEEAQLRHSQL